MPTYKCECKCGVELAFHISDTKMLKNKHKCFKCKRQFIPNDQLEIEIKEKPEVKTTKYNMVRRNFK